MTDERSPTSRGSTADRGNGRNRMTNGAGRRLTAGAIDVGERGDSYVVRMDLPGFEEADIDLDVDDDTLNIAAERDPRGSLAFEQYLNRGRTTASITRSVALPNPVDDSTLSADTDRGVLTVVLPKDRRHDDGERRIDIG